MNIRNEARKLFDAKVNTGKYDHYTDEMLQLLFEDCVNQVATMHLINDRSQKKDI